MKNLLAVAALGIALAGLSLATTSSEANAGEWQAGQAAKIKMAVTEFTPGPNAPGMTYEAKRHLQASMAYALNETKRFHVVDVRNTREASLPNLAAINGDPSTAAAVKLGKQLGVSYVLTGNVVEYTPKGADGFGRVILSTRLIEVATGKVKHADQTTQRSTAEMRTTGAAEMHTRTMRPAVEKLATILAELTY